MQVSSWPTPAPRPLDPCAEHGSRLVGGKRTIPTPPPIGPCTNPQDSPKDQPLGGLVTGPIPPTGFESIPTHTPEVRIEESEPEKASGSNGCTAGLLPRGLQGLWLRLGSGIPAEHNEPFALAVPRRCPQAGAMQGCACFWCRRPSRQCMARERSPPILARPCLHISTARSLAIDWPSRFRLRPG